MSASVKGLTRLVALALPILLGATGCNTYKYFDIGVSFDQATFDDSEIGAIQRCRILVSGADTGNFILEGCPNRAAADPHTGATATAPGGYAFEYSTFADSGTMSFELQAFMGLVDTPACQVGDGKLSLPVGSATTIPGAIKVTKTGPGCSSVSPVVDGSQ